MARRKPPPSPQDTISGLTVPQVARRLRVSEDKVRRWVKRGDLAALNTADAKCGKPRYVVLPEALADFVRRRSAAEPKPAPRRKLRTTEVDYFPDW